MEPGGLRREPFWDTVVRRHPDLTVALLPAEDPAAIGELVGRGVTAASMPSLPDVDALETRLLEVIKELHEVPGLPFPPEEWTAGWLPLDEAAVTFDAVAVHRGLDELLATTALAAAPRLLDRPGWTVQVPEGGMPRVLAATSMTPMCEVVVSFAPGAGSVLRVAGRLLGVRVDPAQRSEILESSREL